jgi:hypothetical protein
MGGRNYSTRFLFNSADALTARAAPLLRSGRRCWRADEPLERSPRRRVANDGLEHFWRFLALPATLSRGIDGMGPAAQQTTAVGRLPAK